MRLLPCLCVVLVVLRSCVHGDHHGHDKGKGDGHGVEHGHEHSQEHGKEHGKEQGHGHGQEHEHHGGGHHIEHYANGSRKIHSQNADFAFSLYKHILTQPDSQSKNVFFSPLSVSLALAALSVGARGHTHQQLFNGLGFNETGISPEEVNEAFHDIIMNVEKQKGVDLSVGGALFIHDTFKPRPEFLQSLKRYFHSEGFTADFTNTTETKDLINNYVKDKTKGKIPELVEDVDTDAVMYLINYVFFKGSWAIPFDPAQTREDVFHVNDTHTVPVQMMTNTDMFHVYYDKDVSTHVLQLYYNESVSMMLILPEKGLEALEKVLTRDLVGKWGRSVKKQEYEIFIPKFSIKTSYSLKNMLSDMGITDLFSRDANFTGIADAKLFVSKVLQKAALDVHEAGSTAAAATGIEIELDSISIQPTLTFNKPFMVIISNHDTCSVMFMGKIVNPTEN